MLMVAWGCGWRVKSEQGGEYLTNWELCAQFEFLFLCYGITWLPFVPLPNVCVCVCVVEWQEQCMLHAGMAAVADMVGRASVETILNRLLLQPMAHLKYLNHDTSSEVILHKQ